MNLAKNMSSVFRHAFLCSRNIVGNTSFNRHYQRPSAQFIVGANRPERPKFFDEDGSLHYEIADFPHSEPDSIENDESISVPRDFDLCLNFELEHAFHPRFAPVPAIGELKREEATEFCASFIKLGVESGCSILGFDGNELVAMCLNVIIDMPDDGHTQLTDAQMPYNKIKDDYQAEIDAGPYKNPKANRIAALHKAMEKDVHLAFPPAAKVISVGRPDAVHKDHRRKGYAMDILLMSVKLGRDFFQCTHSMSRMAVAESEELALKIKKLEPKATKFFRIIHLPDFKASGKPVFTDKHNVYLICASMKEIQNLI